MSVRISNMIIIYVCMHEPFAQISFSIYAPKAKTCPPHPIASFDVGSLYLHRKLSMMLTLIYVCK